MRFLTRTTLSEAFGIVPDLEGITLDHAIERAYRRALFTLGDPLIAETHAIEVTSTLARRWQKESGRPSADEAKGYFAQPNRAFQIELASFSKLNAYKKKLLSEYQSGYRTIDRETMTVWFIDHIVNYGLKRHSSYAAIGILKVLFNYAYEDIDEVLQYTDLVKWGGARDRKDDLRRWKRKLFKSLIDWFGESLLKLKQCEQSEDLFPEHRFTKQTVTDESLNKTFAMLRFFMPLRPKCPLDQNRNSNIRDLETLLKAHANSSSEHTIERERIHVMNHPDDIFHIVNNVSNRDVKAPAEYLELPDFGLDPDGDGPPPIDRQNLPPLAAQERKHIERQVLRRKKRISKLAFESVIIAVDDEERLELALKAPQAVQLRLNEGDTLVELRSRDREGSLPLDSFFVPWNAHVIDSEPLRYKVVLGSKHEIDFLINYERDRGDLYGAVLDIQYRPLVQEETSRSLSEQVSAAFAYKALKWSTAVFLVVILGGLTYRYFTSGGPPSTNPKYSAESNGNSLPSPLPTVDSRATPSLTQAAVPTISNYQWNPTPLAGQSFGGTVTGTGFVSSGTELWFCTTNTSTCYQQPVALVNVSNANSLSVSGINLGAGSWQIFVKTAAGASAKSTAFTPNPTPTASPALAQRQRPRSQKSDGQKYQLIARANLLVLDEYRKSSQTDRSERGEGPGKQSPGSYFRIYASRTGLTSVQIKLPEAAPESPDVVSIDNGFFHSLVPGKIEGVNNGVVTVTFDLQTIPYKRYYLRVAHGDKRPKHYLVKLINAGTVVSKKPDQHRP